MAKRQLRVMVRAERRHQEQVAPITKGCQKVKRRENAKPPPLTTRAAAGV